MRFRAVVVMAAVRLIPCCAAQGLKPETRTVGRRV